MFLHFSLSLIPQLVHMWCQILPNEKFLDPIILVIRLIILVVESGPCLLFLCAVWKFHKNLIKLRFICAASSTSLTEVS
jgi:hypothetical protein